MIALLIVSSIAFVIGVVLIATPPSVGAAFDVGGRGSRERARSLIAGALAAATVMLTSGWLLPALVVGAGAAWATSSWQRRQRLGAVEVVRLDALASWIESVRDVLIAGEQPIGAISSSVGASSPVIRNSVRRLAVGLARQEPDVAFRRFADDLDDPLGDIVAAGLSIAIRRGARTVPVLTALAEQTREQVDRRRLIEAERAPARREVQAVTLVMASLVLSLFLFGRSTYLDAYDKSEGQLFLAVALGLYAMLIMRVQRLATFPRPSRFLTGGGS